MASTVAQIKRRVKKILILTVMAVIPLFAHASRSDSVQKIDDDNRPFVPQATATAKLNKAKPPALPPADTSIPTRVTMYDRGLDAANRFALLGKEPGLGNLCERYFFGRGVPRDHTQAFMWCTKANDAGSSDGAYILAQLYLAGEVVPRDEVGAAQLLFHPADADKHDRSQFLLYHLYDEGRGVAKDRNKALFYLEQAASNRNKDAIAELQRIDKSYQPPAETAPWQVRFNSNPGMYEVQEFRFDSTKHRRLRLSFDKFKWDERWLPMQSICLTAVMPSNEACLSLMRAGTDEMVVTSNLRSEKGRNNEMFLPFKLKSGVDIELIIFASDDQVLFVVNGKNVLTQEINFPVEVIKLACSTATCAFDFEHDPPQDNKAPSRSN
jgi:TPR repeat protein